MTDPETVLPKAGPPPEDAPAAGPPPEDAQQDDPLVAQARLRRDRHAQWLREGDMSVGGRLAQIGVLGWIFVTPTLVGLFLGRWLDARHGSDIFWSAPLMMVGLCLGGWTAWKWMNAR